jgi:Protein of unknown function (DUF2892)
MTITHYHNNNYAQRRIQMSFDFKRMTKLEHNVGGKEKKYRLYAGAALLVISLYYGSPFLLLAGLILVATGYTGKCPIYAGLGKSTCTPEETTTPK